MTRELLLCNYKHIIGNELAEQVGTFALVTVNIRLHKMRLFQAELLLNTNDLHKTTWYLS